MFTRTAAHFLLTSDDRRLSGARNGRSNAQTTRPAAPAMAAIIKKKSGFDMLDQKLPRYQAMKLPMKLVASHTPIIIARWRTGATFDTSESPIGDK
jgi:hypothetical protein